MWLRAQNSGNVKIYDPSSPERFKFSEFGMGSIYLYIYTTCKGIKDRERRGRRRINNTKDV